jgi:hypothetical protein
LLVVGTLALLFALNWGGVRYDWDSTRVLGLFAIFLAFTGLFWWQEVRRMPIYFESVRQLTPTLSGVALIPLMLGVSIGAAISGTATGKVIHYKRLPTAGLAVGCAAMMLLTADPDRLPFALMEALLGLTGIGYGNDHARRHDLRAERCPGRSAWHRNSRVDLCAAAWRGGDDCRIRRHSLQPTEGIGLSASHCRH